RTTHVACRPSPEILHGPDPVLDRHALAELLATLRAARVGFTGAPLVEVWGNEQVSLLRVAVQALLLERAEPALLLAPLVRDARLRMPDLDGLVPCGARRDLPVVARREVAGPEPPLRRRWHLGNEGHLDLVGFEERRPGAVATVA